MTRWPTSVTRRVHETQALRRVAYRVRIGDGGVQRRDVRIAIIANDKRDVRALATIGAKVRTTRARTMRRFAVVLIAHKAVLAWAVKVTTAYGKERTANLGRPHSHHPRLANHAGLNVPP
jgi:hypothetical protein